MCKWGPRVSPGVSCPPQPGRWPLAPQRRSPSARRLPVPGERAGRARPPGPGAHLPPTPPAAHSDPDNVVLCLLAADEDDDRDVALQIHFTLIQAFCCENDINILRVSNPGRLAELLLLEPDASPAASEGAAQPPDLHCVLVTVSARARGRRGWRPGGRGAGPKSRVTANRPRVGVTSVAAFAPLKRVAGLSAEMG